MAKKYIDADLLRKKIDEQMKSVPREVGRSAGTITSSGYGMMQAFQIIRSIIDSLQQKQEEPAEFLSELSAEIDKVSRRYPEVSFAKLSRIAKHFYELGKGSQPQLPANLDEAADAYERSRGIVEVSDNEDCRRAFKAGAEWQKQQMIRDCSAQASYEAEIEKAEERGYNLCKEQMLKDAVEVDVADLNGDIYNHCIEQGLTDEDKVKIVIVKED